MTEATVMWGVDWSPNMRTVMTNDDTGVDPEFNWDDGFQWVAVDPDHTVPSYELMEHIDAKSGTYSEMSKIAVHLNKLQDTWNKRAFVFYPRLLTSESV